MAIAENVGHGRRGEHKYVRNPDGSELLVIKEVTERWENNRKITERVRRKQTRLLADDLPWIAEQYLKHASGSPFEAS